MGKDEKHVLFEICNEPNGVQWGTVKMYADSVITAIRSIDPSTVVIVGTPTWSQDIHEARKDPVSRPDNIMYAFHFYAGTHMGLMARVREEARRIPIFATEWGTSQASGDGGPFLDNAKSFLDLFNDASGQKISWAQWSFADKAEKSAALQPGACAAKAWDSTSCSGTFLKAYIKIYAPTCSAPTPTRAPLPTSLPTALPTLLSTLAPTRLPVPDASKNGGEGQKQNKKGKGRKNRKRNKKTRKRSKKNGRRNKKNDRRLKLDETEPS